jgi:hypothetical protein
MDHLDPQYVGGRWAASEVNFQAQEKPKLWRLLEAQADVADVGLLLADVPALRPLHGRDRSRVLQLQAHKH